MSRPINLIPTRQSHVDPYMLAWIHAALGDKAKALASLQRTCELGSGMLVFPDVPAGLRTDPKLGEVRAELEFQELLRKVGPDVWPK